MITETTKRPKRARKEHTCDECKKPIEPKTMYIGNSLLIDGKYSPMRRHGDCIGAADILEAEVTNHATHGRFLLTVLIAKNPEIKPRLETLLSDYPEVLKRLKL